MSKALAKLHTIKSKITSISGRTFPYYFIIAAGLAAFYNIWFVILLIFLIIKFKKQINIKLLVFFITIILFSFSISLIKQNIKPKNEITGTIIDKRTKFNQYTIKSGINNYLIKTKEELEIGDVVVVKGKFEKPITKTTPYGFDLRKYSLTKNIVFQSNNPSVEVVDKNYFYYPKKIFINYFDIFPEQTKTYLEALFLGVNNFSEDMLKASRSLQISYLLGLSGMLIYAVINILKKLFYYLDIKSSNQSIIIFFILLFWLLIVGSNMVILRVLLLTTITSISKHFNLKVTRLDSIFYTFLLIILINFNSVYQIGFTLSFIIITVMALGIDLFKSKYKIINNYLRYWYGYLFIFPLLIVIQNEVYLLIFIITPIIILIFRKAIIYLFILIFILPFLSPLLEYYLVYLEMGLNYLISLPLEIVFPSFPSIFIFLYYFILIMLFTNINSFRGGKVILFLFINFLVYNKAYLNPSYRLYFLDVGQGDTTILITPFNENVIVIDAYGDILSTLNKLGIRKIDYLILTHPDADHIKRAPDLINNLNVKKIYINPYDEYKINSGNIYKVSSDDFIYEVDFKISFYNPTKNYYENNDNSLAFKLEYLDESILFLGDISTKAEKEIVNRYHESLKSNILKLAHHGSKTSTSLELLHAVKPEIIIISSGRNNIYGFPHVEVLQRIENKYLIYRTDINYTIYYYKINKDLKWLNYYQNYIKYYIMI